jgi:hypothetical protein
MKAALCLAALAAAATAATGLLPDPARAEQDQARRFVVYGRDPCPRGQGDEIVVCARRPETERYRIPKELRDSVAEDDPGGTSWAATAEPLEYVGRGGIQSCSPVGSGGASGCWNEAVRGWRRDRRQSGGEPER